MGRARRTGVVTSSVLAALAVLLALAGAPTAAAAAPALGRSAASSRVVYDQIPVYGLDVSGPGVVLTGDDARRLLPDGTTTVLGPGPSGRTAGRLAGIARHGSRIAYAYLDPPPYGDDISLKIVDRDKGTTSVDLGAYEAADNPDGAVTYGFSHPDACMSQVEDSGWSPRYRGLVRSQPAGVAAGPHGSWIVADSGANALLRVDAHGRVSTIAVLPRRPFHVTPALADDLGWPACTAGHTYWVPAVPTDVEVGPRGRLYVSTSPAVPNRLVPASEVLRVDPRTRHITTLASHLPVTDELALGRRGRIYTAESTLGQAAELRHGAARPFFALPYVDALETDRSGNLWAGSPYDPVGGRPGLLVEIRG